MISPYVTFWNTSPHFRGAFWKISSFLCFSAINGIVRYLSQMSETIGHTPLPAYEVAFFQYAFGFIFLIPWILQNGPKSLKTRCPALQTCRIVLSALGVVLLYSALPYLPLAQAIALMFLAPLITAMGAKLFLKENITKERGLAILIGLVGGGFVSHSTFLNTPSMTGALNLLTFLPILAATCFSGATLMVRRLTRDDSPQLIVTYLLLFMAPILLIPTLLYGVWPETWQWPWLLMMGGLAAGAHLCFSKAYASAEVSYLLPYGFTKWFACALIGFAAFHEVPCLWTCIGAFVIMGSILFLSYGETRKHKVALST